VTTLRLPLEEMFAGRPDSSDGGSRPPRRLRGGWGDAAERAGRRWAVLAWVLVLAALLVQDPGRMTFDTKLGVDIDPVGFYRLLWHLWNPLEWFGGLQDQYIGYAFPMGVFYLVAHALHVPVWVAERIWMSLLIAVGFWGMVRLAEALGLGSRPARLLAGAAFALWPTFTILAGSTSGAVLPGVLAPWAVLPLARSDSARMAAARSGLIVLCMGGINAVSTLAAIVPAGLYVLTRPGRRRWVMLAWWVPAVLLATAWWLVPLLYQGRYGFNFLPYIEQAANTTQTASAAAALRGSSNWVAYLNLGQPWLTAGSVMVGSVWAVAGGTVAAAAGLAGLARWDLPEAVWLRLTAAVGAVWALAGYGGPLGGPLHQQVGSLLNGPLSALRNIYKIEPALAVVLALGIAHVLARGVWPRPAARSIACVAAVAALVGMGLPYLDGKALQPGPFKQVPSYWQQAANWLGTHNKTETTLVVPADSHGIYTWGQPIDEPMEPLAKSPWVQRNLVPFSGGGASDLVNGAEQAIESGTASPGLAGYLARAGIRYVLVRNDLDPAQLGYTPPSVVHSALRASGFTRVASFGQPVPTGPVGDGTALQVEAIEPAYPPLEIFQATDSAQRPGGPAAVLPTASATLVDGGPSALLQLEAQGLLGSQAAVLAGQDTGDGLPVASQDVTDGLRRADTSFGLPNNNTSYTYTAAGTIPPDNPQGAGGQDPRQLLPAGTSAHQTVAVIRGAANVTASSAGSWLWEVPQGDPVNAFDGNPSTAWTEASAGSAAGQWIQVNFDHALDLTGPVSTRLLDDIPRPVATRLVVTTAAGRAVTDTRVTGAAQPLSVPSGSTSWLRITIAQTSGGTAGGPGAGISEVRIPGVKAARYLRPAQEQAGPAPSFSFHRQTATTLGLPGGTPPEASLDRTFSTGGTQRYDLSASVTAMPGTQLNRLLDKVASGTPVQVRVTASSTFGSLPGLRAQNLLETGAGAGWLASGPNATLHVQWKGKRSIGEIDLTASTVGIAAQPTRVLITSPAGTRDVPVPQSGVLRFPPLVTDQMYISFPGVMPTTAYNPLVGDAQQLPVGLASLTIPALSKLNTGLPVPFASFNLACGQGPPVTVDGHTYPTSVSGVVADLTNFISVPLHLCTKGSALTLGPGRHWLSSPGTGLPLSITDLSLTPAGASSASTASSGATPAKGGPAKGAPASTTAASATAGRSLRIGSWDYEHRTMTIGAGAQSYLEVHQVTNAGWTATLNGHQLTPVTLDGWQQAFVVPAGAGGQIVLNYTPTTTYRWLLGASVLAILVLIAAAIWPARRRSRPGPRPVAAGVDGPYGYDGPHGPGGPYGPGAGAAATTGAGTGTGTGQIGYWLAAAVAALVLALVGGLLALVVPAVMLLGWWRPRWVPWLAFLAMCLAGVMVLTSLNHGPQFGQGAFGWPAQAAALVALAAALAPSGPWPRRRLAVAGPAPAAPGPGDPGPIAPGPGRGPEAAAPGPAASGPERPGPEAPADEGDGG
jgi:arabinofuranan 3-O-arabinosyltransferase